MSDRHFVSSDNALTVRLSERALAAMLEFCRSAGRIETGGILVGRYSSDHRMAIVEQATGPGADARAGRFWLIRGIKGLQRLLDRLWDSKAGYYLGEWHFHPGASPDPSRQDIVQMRRIAVSRDYSCPEPILLILGGDPLQKYELHVEVARRQGDRVLLRESSP